MSRGQDGARCVGEPPRGEALASLDPVEPLARAVYESGWRPEFTPGPTRAELREIVAQAVLSSVS